MQRSGGNSFFQLSRDAYNKLTQNYSHQNALYNQSQGIHEFKGHHAGLKQRPDVNRVADVKLQDKMLQDKYGKLSLENTIRGRQPDRIIESNFFCSDEVACRTDNRIKNNMFIAG